MPSATKLLRDGSPRTRARQRGVSSIEYALIASLLAVAIVIGVAAVGTSLESSYSGTASSVASALNGS